MCPCRICGLLFVAPVTRQSGKSKQVGMRRGCSERLRNAVYHLARGSVLHDPHSKRHYTQLRGVGHKHGRHYGASLIVS